MTEMVIRTNEDETGQLKLIFFACYMSAEVFHYLDTTATSRDEFPFDQDINTFGYIEPLTDVGWILTAVCNKRFTLRHK